jgi:acyl-CoA thioester hydrolase
MSNHSIQYRVYYEDTDAGGVVYYANYLKFAERARTELLRDKDIIQTELADQKGIFFVVRHASLDLLKPARLDDLLTVSTKVVKIGGASITMKQTISAHDVDLAIINVKIACVNTDFSPTRLPNQIKYVL